MFDLSMFASAGTRAEHWNTSGTRGTPTKNAGVPLNKGGVPFRNNDLRIVEHMEHVEHLKNSVTGTESGTPDTEEWWEAFNERAAIMEYSGGLPRLEAERQAKVICLDEFRKRRLHH